MNSDVHWTLNILSLPCVRNFIRFPKLRRFNEPITVGKLSFEHVISTRHDWIYSLWSTMCKNTKYWMQWSQSVLGMTEPGPVADVFSNKLLLLIEDAIEGFCKRWKHWDWLDNNTTWKDIPCHEAYEN